MKTLTQIIIAALGLSLLSFQAVCQKAVTEGKVSYSITYPDMEMDNDMAAHMPNETVIYFKDHMSRTDLSMGMGFRSSTIMDNKTGDIISLTDMLGTKTAMKFSGEEQAEINKSANKAKPVIEYTGETREIAGYLCKKAIIKSDGLNDMELFYTDKIKSKSQLGSDLNEINGFPMQYVIDQGGIKMKMTAEHVSVEKISDDLFIIPADYKVITKQEMMQMMGGE